MGKSNVYAVELSIFKNGSLIGHAIKFMSMIKDIAIAFYKEKKKRVEAKYRSNTCHSFSYTVANDVVMEYSIKEYPLDEFIWKGLDVVVDLEEEFL